MGTVTQTVAPMKLGSPKTVASRGGRRIERLLGKHLMGATYATGGDTITMPTAPPGGTLFAINVVSYTPQAGVLIQWDQSTSTPKLKVFVESAGTSAELANGNAGQAATVVFLEFLYTVG